jgi:hypothetical protein
MPHEAVENAAGVQNARKVAQAELRQGRKKEPKAVRPAAYSSPLERHHFCRASASASHPRRSLSDGMLER